MTTFIKKREPYTCRLLPEIVDAAESFAAAHDITMSKLIETAIKNHIGQFAPATGDAR